MIPIKIGVTCDLESIYTLKTIIHLIHRFKSSDWLKEGHMTWIILDKVHVWKLIHVCSFLLFP